MSENQYQCIHFTPKTIEEFPEIKEHIVKRQLVSVDLSKMEFEKAETVLKKIMNAAYLQESRIHRLSTTLFLVIPGGIEVNISELL